MKELWDESENRDEWYSAVASLEARLKQLDLGAIFDLVLAEVLAEEVPATRSGPRIAEVQVESAASIDEAHMDEVWERLRELVPTTPEAASDGTPAPAPEFDEDLYQQMKPLLTEIFNDIEKKAKRGVSNDRLFHFKCSLRLAFRAVNSLRRMEDQDIAIRLAAFEHVRKLMEVQDHLTSVDLKPGFIFNGERIPLVNPQRGIFKPKQMRFLLSIKTVFPKPGGKVWYDDQRQVHRKIFEGDETVDYDFMGQNPEAADNRWLKEAFENQVPIIYFLGIAPGRYQPLLPVFIAGWDSKTLKARVGFANAEQGTLVLPETVAERRYALRVVKQRLHQALFREAVVTAYDGRCALSGLPEPILLDAAHIVADKDEQLGQPVVPNGIPLSKIHHAAFDAHLVGIDPDYRVHVSERLLSLQDGPMLEDLKRLNRTAIRLPGRIKDRPDRDRLAMRFERFKHASLIS